MKTYTKAHRNNLFIPGTVFYFCNGANREYWAPKYKFKGTEQYMEVWRNGEWVELPLIIRATNSNKIFYWSGDSENQSMEYSKIMIVNQ